MPIEKAEVASVKLPLALVGDGALVPCIDGVERPYAGLDAAASTGVLPSVMTRVQDFLPLYSSVHRGAGYKSQVATTEYENAREAALRFAGREGRDDVAIICRNTTEAINHLVYRLRLNADDVVAWSNTTRTCCRGLVWRRAGTWSAGWTARSRLAMLRRLWTHRPLLGSLASPELRISPAGYLQSMRSSRRLILVESRWWSTVLNSHLTVLFRALRTSSRGADTKCMHHSERGCS